MTAMVGPPTYPAPMQQILANYTITLFSDLTKRVTLQNLYNDGGFSNMGVSDAVMDMVDNKE